MFALYLRRELLGRRRQTILVAIGMALAIALVILTSALAGGVRSAQAAVLESVYGVGTDITVTMAPAAPTEGGAPGERFEFGADDGTTGEDGSTAVSQSRLTAGRGGSTFDASAVGTATDVDGVSAAAGVLSLTNTVFDGSLPAGGAAPGAAPTDGEAPADGAGGRGGSFDVNSFSVLGYDPSAAALGPLTAATLSDGRTLEASDAGTDVALLDSAYATEQRLAVGDTLDIGGTTFEVVGVVTSTTSDGSSASDVYLPLGTAQTLAGLDGQISSVYVQAESAAQIPQVQADLEEALPDATVNTQADLASSVSGSLATAANLVSGLGFWLSLLVLAAAVLLAVLFTVSGVTRRTREFGTLKAIGWSNRRIVGQVAGESLMQGLLGGAVGVALGIVGILVVNAVAPNLTTSSGPVARAAGQDGAPMGGFGAAGRALATATADVPLQLPITVGLIALAVGLAVLGGVVAGGIGGWRAARLRPAAAFRSIN